MICPRCETEFPDGVHFCPECGAQRVPDGMTAFDGGFSWEGCCSALHYRQIFWLNRLISGILAGIAVIICLIAGSLFYMLISLLACAAFDLVNAGGILLMRGGKFHGSFSVDQDSVSVSEEVKPPENVFLRLLCILLKIMLFLIAIAALFTGEGFVSVSDRYSRTLKFSKVKAIEPSADRTFILLRKKHGAMKLIVTPEQCDFITEELKKRCTSAEGGEQN